MRTVILDVSSRENMNRRFLRAFEGVQQGDIISFETPALLFKVLSGKRLEVLNIMTGSGSMTISTMQAEVAAWEKERNNLTKKVNWQFTTSDARI